LNERLYMESLVSEENCMSPRRSKLPADAGGGRAHSWVFCEGRWLSGGVRKPPDRAASGRFCGGIILLSRSRVFEMGDGGRGRILTSPSGWITLPVRNLKIFDSVGVMIPTGAECFGNGSYEMRSLDIIKRSRWVSTFFLHQGDKGFKILPAITDYLAMTSLYVEMTHIRR